MQVRWGLAGLLGFEAILVAYTAAFGVSRYTVMAVLAMAALGWAIVGHARTGRLPRFALAALALVTLARAVAQTTGGGPVAAGLWATYLVPLGFALLLVPRLPAAVGIGAVAVARTWFIWWYFQAEATTLTLANVVGAAGAWVWWAAASFHEGRATADEAPQPGS